MITIAMLNQLRRASIIALLQRHGLWIDGDTSDILELVHKYDGTEIGSYVAAIAEAQAFDVPHPNDVLLNVKNCRTYRVTDVDVIDCDNNDGDVGFMYRGDISFGPIASPEDVKKYYRTNVNASLKFLVLRRG